jgi:hypothetical protein
LPDQIQQKSAAPEPIAEVQASTGSTGLSVKRTAWLLVLASVASWMYFSHRSHSASDRASGINTEPEGTENVNGEETHLAES